MNRLLIASAAALALSGCAKAQSDDAFGERVRAYLLENPEVIQEAVERLQVKQQASARATALAAIEKHRQALERDPRDFVANPNGRITVVEFFDYNCGYCKVIAPEVTKLIAENPDVRFVFKEFPIFGAASNTAAEVALSAPVKPRTLEFYKAAMQTKPLDEAAIDRLLRGMGIDPVVARRSGDSAAVQQQIRDVKALAGELGLEGTPAFIVGDTLIPGADLDALKAAINLAKGGGAASAG